MDNWLLVIITLIFSAFFSGLEMAFVSSNKLIIELDKTKGLLSGKINSKLIKHPSDFIATMLVGNNISLVIYGIVMAIIIEPFVFKILPANWSSEFIILIIQTILSTLLILIVAEFLPKVLFRINPNNILKFFALPAIIFYYLFYPIVHFIVFLSKLLLKSFEKEDFSTEPLVFSSIDLGNYVKDVNKESLEKNEIEHELQIFQNAIEFPNIKVRECMIPRTEIIAFEETDSIEHIKQLFIETNLSKILIYNGNIDNIIGYVNTFDLFKLPKTINSILRPVIIVPETMLAKKLLTIFIQQNRSIAVVVDEFGGTSGILTMEDVIEEIFGEIEDEHDTEDLIEKQIFENEYIFSARIEIDYINDNYQLQLPKSNDYETLAGLIIYHFESIPQLNEEIKIGKFLFKILKVSKTHIDLVKLKIVD
jgi:putative hemolysin